MKKLFFDLDFCCHFFALSAVSASAVTNDTVKVGLRYGSSAMFSANLENEVGSGYTFDGMTETGPSTTGRDRGDRHFHALRDDLSGFLRQLFRLPGSRTLGPWHAQISGFDSYRDALNEAEAWSGGYPAWIDGEFVVRWAAMRVGAKREDMAAKCGGDAVKSGPTGVMVTVTRTTEVLF